LGADFVNGVNILKQIVMETKKIDFKKEYKELFRQSDKKVMYVDVPELLYLAIDGEGHPETSPIFQDKIGALYSMVYTLKFMLKEPALQPQGYFDFVIPPLESFWFMEDCEGFDTQGLADWRWTLMLIVGNYYTPDLLEKAKAEILKKGKPAKFLTEVRLEKMAGGKAVQLMHLGPYNEVGPTVEKLMAELEAKNLNPSGKYREIYLNNPCKVEPVKIKTICRMTYK
jgi:hypothetical protein